MSYDMARQQRRPEPVGEGEEARSARCQAMSETIERIGGMMRRGGWWALPGGRETSRRASHTRTQEHTSARSHTIGMR